MKKKKLIPLVAIVSLLVLLAVGGTCIFYFNTREDNLKSDVIKEDVTSKEEKKEEDVLETNIDSETTETETKEENNSSNNSSGVNTSKEETTTKKQETTSSKSSSNNQATNNNTNSGNQSNSTPSNNNTPAVEEPSCTPKKFVMNWVRADFATFDECKAMGDKYLKEYGYFCYDFVDDCGTRYYMLSLYTDSESGIDFHNIPIPE